MAEPGLPKPVMGVRFPSPAFIFNFMRGFLKYIVCIFMISCIAPTKKVYLKDRSKFSNILVTSKFLWPVKGRVIGTFNQVKNNSLNKGIDIKTEYKALVRAVEDGKVIFVGSLRGFGKTIIISHLNDLVSIYANNCKVFVKEGKYVKKGEVIAQVGLDPWTGESVLHFEIRKGTEPVNPLIYLE